MSIVMLDFDACQLEKREYTVEYVDDGDTCFGINVFQTVEGLSEFEQKKRMIIDFLDSLLFVIDEGGDGVEYRREDVLEFAKKHMFK